MRTPLKELSGDAIGVESRPADWSEGCGERWEYFEAQRCEKCNAVVIGTGGESHSDSDNESDCDGYIPQSEGPMMNYFYVLPEYSGDIEEDAKKIVDLPLCLVRFNDTDETGLALTGGGMDLSWEICEAFMLLGYLPPRAFCRLPQLAGLRADARRKWIVAGCRCSAQVTIRRARWDLRSLRDVSKGLERTPAKA